LSRSIDVLRFIDSTGSEKRSSIVTMKPNRNRILPKLIAAIPHALQLCWLLSLGLLLSACKQEAKVGGSSDLAGVYALVSVNGNAVPASVTHEGAALQVRSGTFTINNDGTCSTKTVFVPPSGAEATREANATYTKAGSKLTVKWKGAGTTIGSVEGNTFTMNNEGMVFIYRK
jgi:hypothetical protein